MSKSKVSKLHKRGYLYATETGESRPSSLKILLGVYLVAVFAVTVMLGKVFPQYVYWIMGGMIVVQVALAITLRPWLKRLTRELRQGKVR